MDHRWQGHVLGLVLAASISAFFLPAELGHTDSGSQALPEGVVACRVLEAHTPLGLGLTVVVFHQRDKNQGPRLGALLKQYSGARAKFQTADGKSHDGTVLRLKSCFGRGILLFQAGAAKLTEKENFVLQFSSSSSKERP